MKTIYSKVTVDRKKEFRIVTKALEDNGKIIFTKSGLFDDVHVKSIVRKSELLKSVYPENVDAASLKDGILYIPYVEGKSLLSLISEEGIEKVAERYLSILEKEENITDFTVTEGYKKIFREEDIAGKATKISNLDMTLSNIIVQGDSFKIIDPEWVFDYPVPLDFIKYRALLDIINSGLDFRKEELVSLFKIGLPLDILEKMESDFLSYVLESSYKKNLTKEQKYVFSALDDAYKEINALKDEINKKEQEIQDLKNPRPAETKKEKKRARDVIFPKGTRRRTFAKLMVRGMKHPVWFIRHLTPSNVRKFKKYSKSEGGERAIERLDFYRGNTGKNCIVSAEYELFDMKPRKKYVTLKLPEPSFSPLVSIIIPVYNQFSYTYGCLESIIKNTKGIDYEVIIGDDCSTDETVNITKYVENIIVARNKTNTRFLLNCKNAAEKAKGKYLLFLNNDTNVQENWLSSLFDTLEKFPDAGMVGSKLVYPDGRLQEAGGILWKDGSAWNYGNKSNPENPEYNYRKEADYISGASIMIGRALWDEIGGFDERFVPAYCEDSDLAFEVRKHGKKVIYDPFSVVVHYEGVSNGTDVSQGVKKYQVDNSKKFSEKWKDELAKHYPNAENVFVARERSFEKKKLLMIDHYVPQYDKDAGSRTVFNYLRLFVKLGYQVKFIGENFYRHEPYTGQLQRIGVEVLYGPEYASGYEKWLEDNGMNFDLVFFNRPHITKKFIDVVEKNCPNARFIYYGHDLHYVRVGREAELNNNDKELLKEAKMWKDTEFDIFNKVDLIYYPSVIEKNILDKEVKGTPVKVLQPYFYENVKKIKYDYSSRKGILFVGGFRHGPNYDGIKWFLDEIYPEVLKKYPDMEFHIAGSYPPEELTSRASKNIIIEGFVSDEKLAQLYKEVRMCVIPLRYGAGIKGKVIEAMANGTPVLTTSCGAEGIITDALVVDDTLKELLNLYENKERLTQLSEKSLRYILDEYTEESASSKLSRDLEELFSK